MPQNIQQELQTMMDVASLFGLAASLYVNFEKSKLIPLKYSAWHAHFWRGEILHPHHIIRLLGYPIAWIVTKNQLRWIFDKLHAKLQY